MNGCSPRQTDSKPSSSAFFAMNPTSTRYAGSGTDTPTFTMRCPPSHAASPIAAYRTPGACNIEGRARLDTVVDVHGSPLAQLPALLARAGVLRARTPRRVRDVRVDHLGAHPRSDGPRISRPRPGR